MFYLRCDVCKHGRLWLRVRRVDSRDIDIQVFCVGGRLDRLVHLGGNPVPITNIDWLEVRFYTHGLFQLLYAVLEC